MLAPLAFLGPTFDPRSKPSSAADEAGRAIARAREEIQEAAAWYDERRTGLGYEFLDELERTLDRVAALPTSFPAIRGPAPALGIRRALMRRFPYGVVFVERPADIRVIAVAHAKRRPGYWLHRVER